MKDEAAIMALSNSGVMLRETTVKVPLCRRTTTVVVYLIESIIVSYTVQNRLQALPLLVQLVPRGWSVSFLSMCTVSYGCGRSEGVKAFRQCLGEG